jgi:hypothetical protein
MLSNSYIVLVTAEKIPKLTSKMKVQHMKLCSEAMKLDASLNLTELLVSVAIHYETTEQ